VDVPKTVARAKIEPTRKGKPGNALDMRAP
jgi:hypothetical protein